MDARSLETLFVRFRKRGDSEALARVFDAVAPELLRSGVHLVGDEAEAEDLVQATFLTAIERRESFDATRALRPWLVGILSNQARTLIARRRRHRCQCRSNRCGAGGACSVLVRRQFDESAHRGRCGGEQR